MFAVEIDGTSHQFDEIAVKYETRQNKLESLGIHFLRFNDKDVKKNPWCYHALENKIEQLRSKKL